MKAVKAWALCFGSIDFYLLYPTKEEAEKHNSFWNGEKAELIEVEIRPIPKKRKSR